MSNKIPANDDNASRDVNYLRETASAKEEIVTLIYKV